MSVAPLISAVTAAPANTSKRNIQKANRVNRQVVHIKFYAESGVTLINGNFHGKDTLSVNKLNDLISKNGKIKSEKLFNGSRGGGEKIVTDSVKNYYKVRFARDINVDSVTNQLLDLPIVEEAYAQPKPVPSPSPNYSALQTYNQIAPTGIHRAASVHYPGGDGSRSRIVDIEYSWNTNHEDVAKARNARVASGTPEDPFNDTNHGTAVLGQMVGDVNNYGVTGSASGTPLYLVNAYNLERGWDLVGALAVAARITNPGDVILVEQQAFGPTSDPNGYVPVEWIPEVYDAIKNLTSSGRIVVEPAGNGSQNLDNTAIYGSRFPMGKADSGAIIVGAGEGCQGSGFYPRSHLTFSNYGKRVDLQGPGSCVVTTGYGDLYSAGGMNALYTSTFSGTSSASPVVAAAAASLNSAHEALNGVNLNSITTRNILKFTGTPQNINNPHGSKGNIGQLPDLRAALTTTDTKPPTTPANFKVALNASKQPVLTWSASTDNTKVMRYKIYRNHALYKTVTTTNFTDTAAARNSQYSYKVQAMDIATHRSPFTPTLSITTPR